MKSMILRICLALILIPALMLSGCSKKENDNVSGTTVDSKDAATGAAVTGTTGTGKTDGKTSSGKKTEGESLISSALNKITSGERADSAAGSYDVADATESYYGSEPAYAPEAAADGKSYSLSDFAGSSMLKEIARGDAAGGDYGEAGSWPSDWAFTGEAAGSDDDGDYWDGGDIEFTELPYEDSYITPTAGLLTAGEWNDNLHYDFLRNLLNNGQQQDYSNFFREWDLTPFSRLAVHVSSGEVTTVSGSAIGTDNVCNAEVAAFAADGTQIWKSRTDSKGMTYIFYRLNGGDAVPANIKVTTNGVTTDAAVTNQDMLDDSVMEIVIDSYAAASKKLDLMFMIDTTGSMGDEIRYLQKELEDVIQRVEKQNANLPVRLSCNFYRDLTDDYIVRSNDFTANIASQLMLLNAERANGGGDWEEAVELALQDAVYNHSWDNDSIKLMFMVLDAPPHNTDEIRYSLLQSLTEAADKGIRIIPVASSGIDKSTEFLLRTFAMTTGGTYTFLTDDSGIGGSHIEPTVGDYEVENLNDMLVRIISEYLN